MDVYRLEETGGADLGLEEYFNSSGVSVVEWSQFIQAELPSEYLLVQLKKDPDNDDKRTLIFEAHGKKYQKLLDRKSVV